MRGRERSLFSVACSRARDELIVTRSGATSPLYRATASSGGLVAEGWSVDVIAAVDRWASTQRGSASGSAPWRRLVLAVARPDGWLVLDLRWLRLLEQRLGADFAAGIVLCTAAEPRQLGGRLWTLPLSVLW